MMNTIQIALSGMTAATRKAEASASNIANMTTTGALDPAAARQPYQPLTTAQTAITAADGTGAGVASQTVPLNRPAVPVYSPDSPDADARGMIGAPDTNLVEDVVNLQLAKHSYAANAKSINVAGEMQDALLDMFDRKA